MECKKIKLMLCSRFQINDRYVSVQELLRIGLNQSKSIRGGKYWSVIIKVEAENSPKV